MLEFRRLPYGPGSSQWPAPPGWWDGQGCHVLSRRGDSLRCHVLSTGGDASPAAHDGEVGLLDFLMGEGCAEGGQGRPRFGDQDQPARRLVQAVHLLACKAGSQRICCSPWQKSSSSSANLPPQPLGRFWHTSSCFPGHCLHSAGAPSAPHESAILGQGHELDRYIGGVSAVADVINRRSRIWAATERLSPARGSGRAAARSADPSSLPCPA